MSTLSIGEFKEKFKKLPLLSTLYESSNVLNSTIADKIPVEDCSPEKASLFKTDVVSK